MSRNNTLNENRHHNVPTSRGGMGHESNLSIVNEKRHTKFHEWSCNRPPCTLLRRIALHATGLEGSHALPPSALDDLILALHRTNWEDNYESDAVIWTSRTPGEADRVQYFTKLHLYAELMDVQQTIGALLFGQRYPTEKTIEGNIEDDIDNLFRLNDVLRFFHTRSPYVAMENFLTEKHHDDLSWVKAFREDVRQDLMEILSHAKPISLDDRQRRQTAEVLNHHQCYLLGQILREIDRV